MHSGLPMAMDWTRISCIHTCGLSNCIITAPASLTTTILTCSVCSLGLACTLAISSIPRRSGTGMTSSSLLPVWLMLQLWPLTLVSICAPRLSGRQAWILCVAILIRLSRLPNLALEVVVPSPELWGRSFATDTCVTSVDVQVCKRVVIYRPHSMFIEEIGMTDAFAFPRRPLGKTGLEVTTLCVGAAPLASMVDTFAYAVSEEQALATIRAVFASPINFIDTAASYGDGESERRLGLALSKMGGVPEGYVLATKAD